MNKLQTTLAGLAAAGLVAMATIPAHAAFTTKGTQTVTATATVGGTATVAITSVTILNRSNNAVATTIGWTGATPGAGWLVADQYIKMVTNINTSNGGVQFYTDNTNAAANPRYTGVISSNSATPAGLVDTTDTTQKLPTAWRASTSTLASIAPADPTITATGEGSLWFFHEDHAQVANSSLHASAFGNGDPFVTVYASPGTPLVSKADGQTYTTTSSNSGIHFAQGPTQFGGFATTATTDIYTQADFSGALAATTYRTSRMVLEAFSL